MASFNPADTLDLYDLALLANYERASTDPRFRHAKLREAVFNDAEFQTIAMHHHDRDWRHRRSKGPRAGFLFDIMQPLANSQSWLHHRDLPSNMLLDHPRHGSMGAASANTGSLTREQLESIYWQARSHDACFKSAVLLQHLFDMYPQTTPLRVRTATGEEYVTTVSTRVVMVLQLIGPKLLTLSSVQPVNVTYLTGAEETMVHAVLGFADSPRGNVRTVLDLASMQFGDAGRGLEGKSTFVVEDVDKFYGRLERIASRIENGKVSLRVHDTPPHDDMWLRDVAMRVKARWDNRAKQKWCGHCGAPATYLKCSVCMDAWYCDHEHQNAAWPFHRNFCQSK